MRQPFGKLALACAGALALVAWPAAGAETAAELDWTPMLLGLLGGLALFLFGMDQLGGSLKAVASDGMRTVLARFTGNRVLAAITGAIVTAVVGSSSVTTVLVVGFVSAGVMTLTQSIGVIMGANIGTTMVAQIIAFKVDQLALGLIALGFLVAFVARRDRIRHLGSLIMGLGLVFFGMAVMSGAMAPLRGFRPFMDLMASLHNPVAAIVVGALFTALIQASAATTGIVIVLASGGLIDLQTGIALALGANIGTCVTAGLAAIGKPVEGQRAAAVHILFNVIGVLLWVGLIGQLADLARAISPSYPALAGAERLAAEAPRQIANANTLFNVLNTMLLLGFAGTLGKLAEKLVPARAAKKQVLIEPEYLDRELIATPSLALERVRFELGNLGQLVQTMLVRAQQAMLKRDLAGLEQVRQMDDKVDILFAAVIDYLGAVRKQELSDAESAELQLLLRAAGNMEAIGDHVSEHLIHLGEQWIAKDRQPSETMRAILDALYQATIDAVASMVKAIVGEDEVAAQAVVGAKQQFERLVEEALAHQSARIAIDTPEHLDTVRMEMGLVHSLRDVFSLARRTARSALPAPLAAAAA
jgi:phosphate:Na+ symporter